MALTCTFDPRPLIGQGIGMLHCPECGDMVLAGVEHPDYSILKDPDLLARALDLDAMADRIATMPPDVADA